MTFGEHTALVEEVIDFAFSGRVLFAVGPAEETASAWITDDLQLALEANAGDSEISRFRMVPQQDVSGWGNTDLLGHNMATGDDLRIEDVADDLSWGRAACAAVKPDSTARRPCCCSDWFYVAVKSCTRRYTGRGNNARRETMPTPQPSRTPEELARLGGEVFNRRVRPSLRPEDDGKFVALDVVSGEYEIDPDDYAAVSRLRARVPSADVWLARAGSPATCRIGSAR